MKSDELVAIIESHRAKSIGKDGSDVHSERASALDHYHGRAYGDEQEGRSSVVTRDLSETIDWIMPPIMKAFLQSGDILEFEPSGADDMDDSEQESAYVNHVMTKDNNAFLYLHDAVKDALILKNGYIKHWFDDSVKITESEYNGLTSDQLIKVYSDLESEAEVEVLEHEESIEEIDGQEVPVFDVKLKCKKKVNRVKIQAVPSEEIRISKDCRGSTQEAAFVEHYTTKTRSELIEMGMKKEFVNELPAHTNIKDAQSVSRNSLSSESDYDTGLDKSMDDIEYSEAHIRVDYDNDGVAELRKVITVGGKLPPGSEWNEVVDCVNITSFIVKRIPHRHIGESLDDELEDLQRINTVLTRQLLDNIYLTNNQEYIVNNRVHLPDFLESLPGGVKRVKDDEPVSGCVEPVPVTPIMNQILPAIDHFEKVKDNRTGINKLSTSIDPNVLKGTTKGAYMEGVNRASQKVEMIIRMTAEGVKELALRVHELLLKHQDISRIVRLRGEFVEVNPSEWKERTDLTVNVGLGSGTEDEKQQKLGIMSELQDRMGGLGLVSAKQGYELALDVGKALSFPLPEKYFLDPASEEFKAHQQSQQNQPNPLAEAEQAKGQMVLQAEQLKAQYKGQLEQLRLQNKSEMELLKIQVENSDKERDRQSKEAIAILNAEVQAFIAGTNVDIGKPGIGAEVAEGV